MPAADFQGPIAAPGVRIDPLELVRATRLRALPFDNLPESHHEFAPWVEKLLAQGSEGVGGTPAALGKIVDAELVKWAKLAKDANIRAD